MVTHKSPNWWWVLGMFWLFLLLTGNWGIALLALFVTMFITARRIDNDNEIG